MSAPFFLMIMLIMWAVVALFYVTLFSVGPSSSSEERKRPAADQGERAAEHHDMPRAA